MLRLLRLMAWSLLRGLFLAALSTVCKCLSVAIMASKVADSGTSWSLWILMVAVVSWAERTVWSGSVKSTVIVSGEESETDSKETSEISGSSFLMAFSRVSYSSKQLQHTSSAHRVRESSELRLYNGRSHTTQ
ncbi:hypothetical protein OGAPHI_005821 [Ogataea philodendri]|uniref:Secreted protein n=1 Tax=Ogataea philodendri TaxID=1378263 RepID=A0A9P8T1W7_9ASCO|nr:uncharacterized protein OGAPHI_005821 [Ogataea philodendri]KAH3662569.1 hypothetical protein OGAPHI_005821 [Ogataea philodendri]